MQLLVAAGDLDDLCRSLRLCSRGAPNLSTDLEVVGSISDDDQSVPKLGRGDRRSDLVRRQSGLERSWQTRAENRVLDGINCDEDGESVSASEARDGEFEGLDGEVGITARRCATVLTDKGHEQMTIDLCRGESQTDRFSRGRCVGASDDE